MTNDVLNESLIYRSGSRFQRWAFEYAARYFHARGVRRYGTSSKGNNYAHLLHADDSALNFITPAIRETVADRFNSHKAGDRARTETNTVASQPCCFNLFVPLAQDLRLASAVFSNLMGAQMAVEHIEIEFTPNQRPDIEGYELGERDESLGDQAGSAGTDADLAVFYRFGAERGVLLVEFKYIESEFSTCGSYNTKNLARRHMLRPLCDSPAFVHLVTKPRGNDRSQPYCGYTKYNNWDLTRKSMVIDWEKINKGTSCPFAGSGQQLWRNMLLAENVARQRGIQQFGLWVIAPRANNTLWTESGGHVFEDFARLLRSGEQARLRRLTTESVLDAIQAQLVPGDDRRRWLDAFWERYLPLPRS